MDLKSGVEGGSYLRGSNNNLLPSRRLEGVILAQDRIRHLFLKQALHLSVKGLCG